MDSNQKILSATGSNKGIGYALIEWLLNEKSHLRIILLSNNENIGESALKSLI